VPRQPLGQHFLVDRAAARRIVDLAAPGRAEPVLEIGPGRGALTGDLLERTRPIAAVELDRELAAALRATFGPDALRLYEQDVLRLDLGRVRQDLGAPTGVGLVVVSNLPYAVSKPVAQKLVREREHVDRAVLMFQREVAARLLARPGSRDYAPLTVLAGRVFAIERAFDLSPGAFRPRPEVVSTVTRWTRRRSAPLGDDEERRLRACLEACFRQRRRTLRANLARTLGSRERAERLLGAAGLDPGARAEQLAPDDFARLAGVWDRALV